MILIAPHFGHLSSNIFGFPYISNPGAPIKNLLLQGLLFPYLSIIVPLHLTSIFFILIHLPLISQF